jgi:hypothetical protein
MAPLPHNQDITSWPQLLSAIEDAEAGRGTGRLTEICLSFYSALAATQFQITQLADWSGAGPIRDLPGFE